MSDTNLAKGLGVKGVISISSRRTQTSVSNKDVGRGEDCIEVVSLRCSYSAWNPQG